MADEGYRKDYPQQHRHEESQARPHSHYTTSSQPTSSENTQRPPQAPQANMAASITLPSIHDSRAYGPQAVAGRGYGPDPRYASPSAVNGYPPPGQQMPGQQAPPYLPPLQPQGDPRTQGYPMPPDQRGSYYEGGRPPYGQEQPQQQPQQYPADHYYAYRPAVQQGPPPGVYRNYQQFAGGIYEYPLQGQPTLTQAAPRQRTSIACRYCRKRKIRCSGYQSAPGGKCQNCARMNQECIFQPVSSSSSTAFIPVSAVPGGVPPGTQLFGAYGQPLAPSAVPPPPVPTHQVPAPQYHTHPMVAHPPPAAYYHQHPVQSPTESYSSYGDTRSEETQVAGRRRRRTSEEQDESYRLPPPRVSGEEDPRRRSPAEFSNTSSPGGLNYPTTSYAKQSPRNLNSGTLPQGAATVNYASSAPGGRSPTGQNSSSGASTPARQGPGAQKQQFQQGQQHGKQAGQQKQQQPGQGQGKGQGQQAQQQQGQQGQQQQQGGGTSVMSLSNLVDKNDIDKTMIDRLNRPRDSGTTNNGSRN